MNEEIEREAFEKWISEDGKYPRVIDKESGGGYKLMSTASYWYSWQARAALAATPAAGFDVRKSDNNAAAPVVLPEPDFQLKWSASAGRYSFSKPITGDVDCYTADTVRALLATGGQAQAVKLLAADHSGMKVDYRGLFSQVQRALKRTDPGYAEMLRQLEGHLQELGQRWYAGDTDVVDEILQLYCIERDARKTVGVTETAAPQAQADLYKAKADRYDFIVEKKLILSGGTEQFGWPIAPFGSECDRYIDAAIAAAKE